MYVYELEHAGRQTVGWLVSYPIAVCVFVHAYGCSCLHIGFTFYSCLFVCTYENRKVL